MSFIKIDRNNWNRTETFQHFSADLPCTYSMNVHLDVTNLLKQAEKRNLKFFPIILYGIAHIVNAHQEFRMETDSDGNLGYHEKTNPCFTVFHDKTERFTNVWTEYESDIQLFYNRYLDDMAAYGQADRSKPAQKNNLFNVSCIPWVSFTGFNLNLQKGYAYYPPIFTIGKYFQEQEKVLLPFALQVHHAVCDGFHAARFVNELQEWADSLSL